MNNVSEFLNIINLNDKEQYLGEITNYPRVSRVFISPERAKQILRHNNPNNRNLSAPHVASLAGRMDRGEWMLNGQTISFSIGGNLLDGQHRLAAVIKHGKPVKFDVVFGLDDNAFDTIDDGKKRSPGDVLNIHGFKNGKKVASSVRLVLSLQKKRGSGKLNSGERPSNKYILSWIEQRPEFLNIERTADSLYRQSTCPVKHSVICALLYLLSEKYGEVAKHYFTSLCIGQSLSKEDVVFKLRSKLIKDSYSIRKMNNTLKMALIIYCFHKFRKGQTVRTLKYSLEQSGFPAL